MHDCTFFLITNIWMQIRSFYYKQCVCLDCWSPQQTLMLLGTDSCALKFKVIFKHQQISDHGICQIIISDAEVNRSAQQICW